MIAQITPADADLYRLVSIVFERLMGRHDLELRFEMVFKHKHGTSEPIKIQGAYYNTRELAIYINGGCRTTETYLPLHPMTVYRLRFCIVIELKSILNRMLYNETIIRK